MATLTKSAFARECGVAPAAITYAVKHHLVEPGPDGKVDPNVEPNRTYLAGKRAGVKAPSEGGRRKRGSAAKTSKRRKHYTEPPPVDGENVEDDEEEALSIQKYKADIEWKKEQRLKSAQTRLKDLRLLIPRDEARKVLGRYGGEIRVRFLDMPKRISDRLAAMTDPHELQRYLEQEITDALKHAEDRLRDLDADD